jgi:hypothetical protein
MKRAAAMTSLLALLTIVCGSPSASTTASSSRSGQTPRAAANFKFDILSAAADGSAASAARTASWITCSGAIGQSDPVAVVQLHAAADTGELVLRDYADPSNPRTACQFHTQQAGHGYGVAQLIDAHHVVIQSLGCCQTYAVVDLPEVRYHWFNLPGPPGFRADFLAVSPGLNEIAWESIGDSSGADRQVHLTTRSGDQVAANLPPALGRCGSPNISKQGAYTHSGSHLYVLDQPLPDNVLIVFQGKQQMTSLVPPGGGWPKGAQPEMAVWSPTAETLFYRQNGDVWQWTQAGGAQRYLSGVNWYYPTFSPSGSHLAYSVPRSDGLLHDIYLVDFAHGGSPQLIKGARNYPVFLNSAQLWYWSESQSICGPGLNHPLVYDINDGSETSSIVDQVVAVWPATSSNF